jgi:glucose/arabinose dehydrogenase
MMRLNLNPRRWLGTRRGRVTAAALLLAALIGLGGWARDALRPNVYFISGLSLKYYQADRVPEDVVAKLEGLSGKEFVSKSGVIDAIRTTVGAEAFRAHESALSGRIRTRHCWPNSSPQRVHAIQDSRGHPLHNRFGIEVLIPQRELPPVATQLEFLPGGAGVLVLGKFGHLTWFGPDWKPRMTLQVPGVFEGGEDVGALGMAVDPDFAQNRFVYIAFVSTQGNQNVIQRVTLATDAGAAVASRVDILRLAKDRTQDVHGIGALHFSDRFTDPLSNAGVLLAQVGKPGDASAVWADYEGAILALLPGRGPAGGYTALPTPVAGRALAFLRRESTLPVARGLRSPFTGAPWRGRIIIGDVGASGAHSHEEVNVFTGGEDFGWPRCQDPHLHGDFTPPIIAYRRNDPAVTVDDPEAVASEGRSVIVGVVYDGVGTDRYRGTLNRRLLYGDFYLGFLRGARLTDQAQVEDDVFLMHLPSFSSMRIGPDGFIYGVTAIGDKGFFRLLLKRPPGQ